MLQNDNGSNNVQKHCYRWQKVQETKQAIVLHTTKKSCFHEVLLFNDKCLEQFQN